MESKLEETKQQESRAPKRRKEEAEGEEGAKKKAYRGDDKDSTVLFDGKVNEEEPTEKIGKAGEEQLEDFEIGASEHVTKQDAMKLYCLPNGTLAVCEYIEKPNPRNGSWKPMKLYKRSEIRRRARERFGGLEELVAERKKREAKRLEQDMSKAQDFFR